MKSNGIIVWIVALLIVGARIIWRQKNVGRKPIKSGGISIFYSLIIYVVLIIWAGSKMFVNPNGLFVIPPVSFSEIIEALILGTIFAFPMILTTNYEIRENGQIYTKANKCFVYFIIGLMLVRYGMEKFLFRETNPLTTLILVFILLITYLTIWRVASFLKYRKLSKSQIG